MSEVLSTRYSRSVAIWIWIGVAMIAIQILVGGVTRLTGSGLSITRWEIVTGTLPPLSSTAWEEEFDEYKATPQYEKINRGMSLDEFKFIYFWEYFHRLWARLFGIVFVIPFFYFLVRGKLDRALIIRLIALVLLGALVATFGWIMVASGLIERPWVDAYKLTVHLNLGMLLYAATFVTALFTLNPGRHHIKSRPIHTLLVTFIVLFGLQLLIGGLMSGMKAGLYYPTWPEMGGQWIPDVMRDGRNWSWQNMAEYDQVAFAPALVQFMHRLVAYLLLILVAVIWWKAKGIGLPKEYRLTLNVLYASVGIQVVLGILTVINCIGGIPLFWGVAHQAGAILLLSAVVVLLYHTKSE